MYLISEYFKAWVVKNIANGCGVGYTLDIKGTNIVPSQSSEEEEGEVYSHPNMNGCPKAIFLHDQIADLESCLAKLGGHETDYMNTVVRRAAKQMRLEIDALKEELDTIVDSKSR